MNHSTSCMAASHFESQKGQQQLSHAAAADSCLKRSTSR